MSCITDSTLYKLTLASSAILESTETIKLVSSDGGDSLLVHKELLCFYSKYYTAALKGNFLEAQKDRFEVPLSSENVEAFVRWIYTGQIDDDMPVDDSIHLYIFADQMDILALRRPLLTGLAEHALLDWDAVKLILTSLPPTSQLHDWIVNSYVAHWELDFDDDYPCPLNSEEDPDHLFANFIYKVMKGIAVRDNSEDVSDRSECWCCSITCYYHEHTSNEEWEASMSTQNCVWSWAFFADEHLACGQKEGVRCPHAL